MSAATSFWARLSGGDTFVGVWVPEIMGGLFVLCACEKLRNIFADSSSDKSTGSLFASCIDTPIGPIIAVADGKGLWLLEFFDRPFLAAGLNRLMTKVGRSIVRGENSVLVQIRSELQGYFAGTLSEFSAPYQWFGTSFQKAVWSELARIEPGSVRSYKDIALKVSNPKGFRAVARANAANQLAVVVPCHRVINTSGELGGYAGGVARKKWLLEHEARLFTQ